MSYEIGMAAINLEMPKRVPRTEYSATEHWDLIQAETDLKVNEKSSEKLKSKAKQKFMQKWNFDLNWSVLVNRLIFGDNRSKMGHAEYVAGGGDYDNQIVNFVDDPQKALKLDPIEVYGIPDKKEWIQKFEEHYQNNCDKNPDCVNMTGIYVTLISGLIEIFGWDMLLLALGTNQKEFGKLANRYAEYMQYYFEALAETDVPVVMIHDDIVWTSGAFINPDWYREYVFPNYKKYFTPLIKRNKKILFTSDGNYSEFIDDIADSGVHGFVLEPTTDMEYIARKYGQTHAFIGNADTRILLKGTKKEIRAEVERCMDIGKNCPGFIMAVGNHIPANTPVENAIYYNEVYQELCWR